MGVLVAKRLPESFELRGRRVVEHGSERLIVPAVALSLIRTELRPLGRGQELGVLGTPLLEDLVVRESGAHGGIESRLLLGLGVAIWFLNE